LAKKDWDRDSVVSALRALSERLGRVPTLKDLNGTGGPCWYVIRRLFGSFNAALEAAGLPVRRRSSEVRWRSSGRCYSEAVAALREAAQRLGRVPTGAAYDALRLRERRSDWPSAVAVRVLFGTWREALRVAGFQVEAGRRQPARTRLRRQSLVGLVVRAVEERGFALPGDYECLPGGLAERARRAIVEAGVPLVPVRGELAGMLEEVWRRGWPDVPGCERGRKLVLRLVSGEGLAAVSREEGLSVAEVEAFVREYLARAVRGLPGDHVRGCF